MERKIIYGFKTADNFEAMCAALSKAGVNCAAYTISRAEIGDFIYCVEGSGFSSIFPNTAENNEIITDIMGRGVSVDFMAYLNEQAAPEQATPADNVNHPAHYTSDPSGVECIDVTKYRDFCIGNAMKYLWRAGLKHDADKTNTAKEIEDLKKAIWYIERKIELLEEE